MKNDKNKNKETERKRITMIETEKGNEGKGNEKANKQQKTTITRIKNPKQSQ